MPNAVAELSSPGRLAWWYRLFWLLPRENALPLEAEERDPDWRASASSGATSKAETVDFETQFPARSQVEPADAQDCVEVPGLLSKSVAAFVERVKEDLRQDCQDAITDGDPVASRRACDTCLSFARLLAPHVALSPRLKWAAFCEDAGAVSLVLQSLVTNRRLNCTVSADGTRIRVIRTHERTISEDLPSLSADVRVARELGGWVANRA